MAAPASSSLFMSLGNAWRLLSLRSDVDDIILELLGHFSLEKIYAESDKETYQHLLTTLLAQLNTIFYFQRLTVPSENLQVGSLGWYLGFLASWEVTLRSVEFILQVVQEGRENLWEAESLRDKYLPEFLLSALRLITLHPKAPANQRAKDRRERFARIHRSLERIHDSYPGSKSFLFLICREITGALKAEPNGLALPTKMRYELPNLASDLYPLHECLSSQYVSTIAPKTGFSTCDWLSQFLALRDVSHFVVAASIQYSVNRETRDVRLQSSSARTRNAVLHALENLQMPEHLSQVDMIATFSETFRIILPDTPSLERRGSSDSHQYETKMDATDALCLRLSERQVIHRVSDREMMHSLSKITRSISLLDDPTAQVRAIRPRLYAVNCPSSHLAGDSQLRSSEDLKFPEDPSEGSEIMLPSDSKCIYCGEPITMLREVSLAQNTWEILKPLEPNPDTINVERHLPTRFRLEPPKFESGLTLNPNYNNIFSGSSQKSFEPEPYLPHQISSPFSASFPQEPSRSISQALRSPQLSNFRQNLDTQRTDTLLPDGQTPNSSEGGNPFDIQISTETPAIKTTIVETPISPDSLVSPSTIFRGPRQSRGEQSPRSVCFENVPSLKSRPVPLIATPEKPKSGWRSKISRSRRDSPAVSGDTSSLSSTTLESQRLEEICLKSSTTTSKGSARSKSAKKIRDIKVYLSQNSSYALFWSQSSIHVFDVGKSPPTIIHATSTDSTCVLAALTKVHLAYIIKSQEQKLTLRIINLVQPQTPVVEYRMAQSPYCTSISICPKENYVVVGFDKPIVRFFRTSGSEAPREDRLHSRYHEECKEKDCAPVGTLSFSTDGLALLASTRSLKNGTISFYSWRYPFDTFQEESKCRYHVALHESEDNGVSSAIFRPGSGMEPNLICVTTWTLSGSPLLIQPEDGQKSDIKTDRTGHQGQLGSRIQCATFSPSGKELAMVNAKGHLYQIVNLNSNPLDVRRIATSLELTKKEDFFAMSYMALPDEDAIVLAWADSSKDLGYVKKIPVRSQDPSTATAYGSMQMSHDMQTVIRYELPGEGICAPETPAEMSAPEDDGSHKGKTKENY